MPRLSQTKKDKITEQILHYLFTIAPQAVFTTTISKEIARDEEFTLILLKDLHAKNLIVEITKNPQGADYRKRRRWRLSDKTYAVYTNYQSQKHNNLYNEEAHI